MRSEQRKRSPGVARPLTQRINNRRIGLQVLQPTEHWRPKTRSDCASVPRPCPYVGCRHHLYLEVLSTGNLQFVFPDQQWFELEETCSLDVADRGGLTDLNRCGRLLNITSERVRQVANEAQAKVRARLLGV